MTISNKNTPHRIRAKTIRGFLTLEMLIAMTILLMTISAVTLASFGGKSLITDGETSAEALHMAQGLLENAQFAGRKDFRLVNPTSTDETIGSMTYHATLEVSTTTAPDYATKKIKSTVSWTGEHARMPHVTLSALVTNFDHAVGGDTCDSVLSGDWHSPLIKNAITDFAQLVGDAGNTYAISDLDAYKNKLYVTINNSSVNTRTFFVFDTGNPSSPLFSGGIDDDANNTGLNAVRVAEGTTTGTIYAYVASASSFPKGQLEVIDVSTPSAPKVVARYKIATSTVSSAGVGNSIFYKDGLVYLGLTTATGPEFHVIDVHRPKTPFLLGSYEVGNDVNAILVRGNYAYLATPNTRELIVLDVSNPVSPSLKGHFNSASGSGGGKSIALVGDRFYLGKTVPNSGNDLHVLDDVDPTATLPELGGDNIVSSVNGIVVRDYLLFALTNTDLQIFNMSTTTNPTPWATLLLPGSGSATHEPSLDCEGNILYASSNDTGDHGILSVISAP